MECRLCKLLLPERKLPRVYATLQITAENALIYKHPGSILGAVDAKLTT